MKPLHRVTPDTALEWLAAAPALELAGSTVSGRPLLRTLHAAYVDGAFSFHGKPNGEKAGLLGRPVVVGTRRTVARIPSYFRDAERACPATTYYESAEAEGVAEEVTDPDAKAHALMALMQRLQPEGGYLPITSEQATGSVVSLYRNAVNGLLVFRVVPARISGKAKLGQERSVTEIEHIVAGLWRRGDPGDVEAIERILEAHPERPVPAFLRGPAETRLSAALSSPDVAGAVRLLSGQHWNEGASDDTIARAQRASTAWVGARLGGRLVATARAVSDTTRRAAIYDVAVAPELRGRGVGTALFGLLLDHPAVRGVERIEPTWEGLPIMRGRVALVATGSGGVRPLTVA